jgi:UDP-N-acetylglucosamine:LPS N-acetylglucosamine transferase
LSERADLLLVCSPGGHMLQLARLAPAWKGRRRVWVTLDAPDTRSLLAGEQVEWAHGPTNRSVKNLVRNLQLAWVVVRRERPRVLLTTGAGVAVPFAWIARLFGAHIVYVESLTRIDTVSLSCRLIRPAAHRIYVQWPELRERLPEARYAGTVVGSRA